ncbi:unnamed protein product [Symbiodinium sp. CCMP2456]|nr:unnamed protein product [Symbiodinium sp. CCMP2456]
MATLTESRGSGGEIKLFPPPVFKGEHDKWEDWSWQSKAYVALYKPVAQELMDRIQGSSISIDDAATQLEENNTLIVRLNEPGNGFETWRQLHDRFALPSREKGVSLLNKLLEHQFRDAHFEADLAEFIVLKNKHERATGNTLSDDIPVALMMNKTRGQLQQHLRLQAISLKTFDQVLVIVKEYYQSKHLVSGKLNSSDHGGPAPMDVGALWKGNEWNEDWNADWNGHDHETENGESIDWQEYQGALFDDMSWSEDDWSGDWWSDDGYDWSMDWSWQDDSSWHWSADSRLALPPPPQAIAQPQTAASLLVLLDWIEGDIDPSDVVVPHKQQDRLAAFHSKSGAIECTWILFDSGASANCCPPWLADDYPLLPIVEDGPILRSISGKTLGIIGKRIIELDCGNHSLCVHFYVCQSIPCPLVSVARLLLQDFWTIMSRNFMALLTRDRKTVPIIRPGTLVFMTPKVAPYQESDCPYTDLQVSAIVSELDLDDCDIELRSVTDTTDIAYDHIPQIHSLIAAAKKGKVRVESKPKRADLNIDYWVVDEDSSILIRHHVQKRKQLMGFRNLRGELPIDESRLTGYRKAARFFLDGTSDVVTDENFCTNGLTLVNRNCGAAGLQHEAIDWPSTGEGQGNCETIPGGALGGDANRMISIVQQVEGRPIESIIGHSRIVS